MRGFRVLGTLLVVAATCLYLFTDRGEAAMVLLITGIGLVMTDHYRVRARNPGG